MFVCIFPFCTGTLYALFHLCSVEVSPITHKKFPDLVVMNFNLQRHRKSTFSLFDELPFSRDEFLIIASIY